jgi:hypothetical protein
MAQQSGAFSRLLLGFETTFKTAATAGFVMPINSSSVKGSRNQNTAATIRGNLNPVEPFDGNTSVSGQVVVPVDSIAFWYWLKALFGDPTTTGTSPYVHVFKAGNERPSLTLEHQFPDLDTAKYFQYTGCKVNGMSLNVGGDGELTASFDIIGAKETIAAASFDASPTAVGFSRLKNNQAAIQEGGSSATNVTQVDTSININCDSTQYVIGGGGELGSIPDGVMAVSGNFNALFENTISLEKAVNSTESSLQTTIADGPSSILDILMPELKYSLNSPGIDGPQGIAISLPYSAYYEDATEETSVQITLTNTEEHAV